MSDAHRIVGTNSKALFIGPAPPGATEWRCPSSTTIGIARDDQIVTVGASVTLAELQSALREQGLCLPLPDPSEHGVLLGGFPGTVGGLIASNMPHGLSAQYGGPREWLLQIETQFQGMAARSGAKVVKSVAGFDVHKVYVGSRGLLGPIMSATFRTWPISSIPGTGGSVTKNWAGEDVWILRTLVSDFDEALGKAQDLLAYDRPSCTLWQGARPSLFQEGWMIGPRGELWTDNQDTRLAQRIKDVFDTEGQWV